MSYASWSINVFYVYAFIAGGLAVLVIVYSVIKKITMTRRDYDMVMRVKYMGGLLFSLFIALLITLKY